MENVTMVTALYNIKRETDGDGRKWEDYLEWFKETLQLPFSMMIFIPKELQTFVDQYRPSTFKTFVVIQELQEIPYAFLEKQMADILQNPFYQKRIACPNRVECKIPFYNIIQYSKFRWLRTAATMNPFESDYFFWIDAGISRFIPTIPTTPFLQTIKIPAYKLLIQNNYLYYRYPVSEEYLWDAQCLLCGTMFGGDKDVLLEMCEIIESELVTRIQDGWNNNEQILLAYIEKVKRKDLFQLVFNDTPHHLCLVDKFFIYHK